MKYDLAERTALFGENIIKLCQKTKKTSISIPILDQLVKSGTSIGANYMEACGGSSLQPGWFTLAFFAGVYTYFISVI